MAQRSAEAEKRLQGFINVLLTRKGECGRFEYFDCPICRGKKTAFITRTIPNKQLFIKCTACDMEILNKR